MSSTEDTDFGSPAVGFAVTTKVFGLEVRGGGLGRAENAVVEWPDDTAEVL